MLILGGTSEARALAAALDRAGVSVVTSLAGRTSAPRGLAGRGQQSAGSAVPTRWRPGSPRMASLAVVDATHPFAERISASAVEACACVGVPLLRLERPPWREQPGDRWHRVDDLDAAASLVPSLGRPRLADDWPPGRRRIRRGRRVLVPDPLRRGAGAAAAGAVRRDPGSRPVHARRLSLR